MGTVTFCFDGDEDFVQEATEKIQQIVADSDPELFAQCSVTEDVCELDE